MSAKVRSLLLLLSRPFGGRRLPARVAAPIILLLAALGVAAFMWSKAKAQDYGDPPLDFATTYDEVRRLRTEVGDNVGARDLAAAFLDEYATIDADRQLMHYEYAAALFCNGESAAALTSFGDVVDLYGGLGLADANDGSKVDDALFFIGLLQRGVGDDAAALTAFDALLTTMSSSNRAAAAGTAVLELLIKEEDELRGGLDAVDNLTAIGDQLAALVNGYADVVDTAYAVNSYADYLSRRGETDETIVAELRPLIARINTAAPNTPAAIRATLSLAIRLAPLDVDEALTFYDDAIMRADATDDERLQLDTRFERANGLRRVGRYGAAYNDFVAIYENWAPHDRGIEALVQGNQTLSEEEYKDWHVSAPPLKDTGVDHLEAVEGNLTVLLQEHGESTAALQAVEDLVAYHFTRVCWNREACVASKQRISELAALARSLGPESETAMFATLNEARVVGRSDCESGLSLANSVEQDAVRLGVPRFEHDAQATKAHILSWNGRGAEARAYWIDLIRNGNPIKLDGFLGDWVEAEFGVFIGFSYLNDHDYDAAETWFNTVAEGEQYPDCCRAMSLMGKAHICVMRERPQLAQPILADLLERFPDTPIAVTARGLQGQLR